MGRGRVPASSAVDVDIFSQFFADKITKVRQCTSGERPPTFSRVRPGVSLPAFASLTIDDVTSAVRHLPDKSSAADPLPATILKQVVDLLSPFITELFNRLLATGRFPAGFRQAFITPIVKSPDWTVLLSTDIELIGTVQAPGRPSADGIHDVCQPSFY